MGRSRRPLVFALAVLLIVFVVPSMVLWHLSDWTTVAVQYKSTVVTERRADTTRSLPRNFKIAEYEPLFSGPVAGQGFSGRLQCEHGSSLSEAIAETPRLLPCEVPSNEVVTIVTMFVANPQVYGPQPSHASGLWLKSRREERRLRLLSVFLQSVEISMPGSPTVVISDPRSELGREILSHSAVVKRMHGNFTRENLMLQRLESYIAFLTLMLERHGERGTVNHVIFGDADMIFVDDLRCTFTQFRSWHVALTFRNNRRQPINSGILMVRGTYEGLTRGRKFLKNVLKVYKGKFSENAKMLGDQLAFAYVIRAFSAVDLDWWKKPEAFTAEVLNTEVLFLPCLSYNWTPAEGSGQFHGMPEDVKVLHFKGSTKRLMLEAWKVYSAGELKDFTSMKCLILKSGRAKYEF